MPVVLPHAVIGNFLQPGPDGHGFIGLGGGAAETVGAIDMAKNVRAVGHGKLQLAELARRAGGNDEFLLGFADGSLERGFTGIDFTAGTIDFPRAEPPLLFN